MPRLRHTDRLIGVSELNRWPNTWGQVNSGPPTVHLANMWLITQHIIR